MRTLVSLLACLSSGTYGWRVHAQTSRREPQAQASRRTPHVQMIDLAMVKKLRAETGIGIGACKEAVREADGDYDAAIQHLRKIGIMKAGKRSGKSTTAGVIHSYVHSPKLGVMLEVNCETDFVAKTDGFKEMVEKIATQIILKTQTRYVSLDDIPAEVVEKEREAEAKAEDLQGKPDDIRDNIVEGRLQKALKRMSLLDQLCYWDETLTVEDYVKDRKFFFGENLKISRFIKMQLGETEDTGEEKEVERVADNTAQAKAADETKETDEAKAAAWGSWGEESDAAAGAEDAEATKETDEDKASAWGSWDEEADAAVEAKPVEAAAAETSEAPNAGAELSPSDVKSDFLRRMVDRGFFNQCSDLKSLDEKMLEGEKTGKPVAAYLGFDATANSLHVGSLLQIMILRHLQKSGHKPIVLVGGGTTKVGDPSGKDESRKMLTEDDIQSNIDGITSVFKKFLVFGDGSTDAELVNNDDWLSGLNYLQFLRDYGKHFTINRMLSFDSVKLRLEREQPLTFLEFNYMILQGFDFLELHRRKGVQVQIGGSDQWGNIINGVELGRRVDQASLFGLTAPLITKSDGSKMGKTASGAVWLNEDLLSPYDYWQFWRNCDDADVEKFLKIFTELPLDEIQRLASLEGQAINDAKIVLADEATSLLHGADKLEGIKATAKSLFGGGGSSDANLPTVSGEVGKSVVDLYIDLGFAKSKGEVRRLIAGGGARLNDVKIEDGFRVLAEEDFSEEGKIKLSSGKKKHGIVLRA